MHAARHCDGRVDYPVFSRPPGPMEAVAGYLQAFPNNK